jgi:basic amino acid/polyamine antiporter, APA family
MTGEGASAAGESMLARRLGVFDATMIVMGGIIGSGIFINPSVVAREVHTPGLILLPWMLGGAIALFGAFVYAELATIRPEAGGQYVYLRDAYHPMVAFLYGWGLLLVTQTGGMAAVAVTFANYFRELTGVTWSPRLIAVITLAMLTIVNCYGVRAGSNVQNALMVTKLAAIAMLVALGWLGTRTATSAAAISADTRPLIVSLGAAMVPVLFAYGGWQTASFVSGELKDPRRDLPRGLIIGVVGVVLVYLAVNVVCLSVLGPGGLAATRTPASEVMRLALGSTGARLIAAGIAVSTVGFLSQGMLTAPRVYYAMARDGIFFKAVGRLDPRSRAPVVAIILQGVWASVIAISGSYETILSYVVALDAVFFGLTGASLLVFRRRARARDEGSFRVAGHPWTTLVFVAAFWIVALNTVIDKPMSAGIGVLILIAGVPVYLLWRRGPNEPAA